MTEGIRMREALELAPFRGARVVAGAAGLPPETSFEEIITAVLGQMLNTQALRLQRSVAVHDRFTRIVLGGGGLREIAQALAELLGRPALIVDPEGTVLAHSTEAAALSAAAGLTIHQAGAPADSGSRLSWASVRLPSGTCAVALQPILADAWRQGAVVVPAEQGSLGEDDLVALEHAATVAALRLVQARAVAEADRRFRTVCLEELVTGHVPDRDVLLERVEQLVGPLVDDPERCLALAVALRVERLVRR